MNKILRKVRKIFYLNQIRLGPRFGRLHLKGQERDCQEGDKQELLLQASV